MSDFGSIITVKKSDNGNFSPEERQMVISIFNEEKEQGDYEDMSGEPLQFLLFGDDSNEIVFMFSEFWYGEGDDEEMFEFAKDHEIDQIEEIANIVSEKLGSSFTLKGDFIDW